MTEYERFELVFMKTRVYKFGHCRDEIRTLPAKTSVGGALTTNCMFATMTYQIEATGVDQFINVETTGTSPSTNNRTIFNV
jgi:hypothetical protein